MVLSEVVKSLRGDMEGFYVMRMYCSECIWCFVKIRVEGMGVDRFV